MWCVTVVHRMKRRTCFNYNVNEFFCRNKTVPEKNGRHLMALRRQHMLEIFCTLYMGLPLNRIPRVWLVLYIDWVSSYFDLHFEMCENTMCFSGIKKSKILDIVILWCKVYILDWSFPPVSQCECGDVTLITINRK